MMAAQRSSAVRHAHDGMVEHPADWSHGDLIEETYREALERIDDVLTNPQLWMFGPEDVARTIARKALGR